MYYYQELGTPEALGKSHQYLSLLIFLNGKSSGEMESSQWLLRRAVDEWIETGRRTDGSECAAGRDLTRAPHMKGLIANHVKKHPPKLIFRPSGPQLLFSIGSGGEHGARLLAALMFQPEMSRLAKCRRCSMYFLLDATKAQRKYKNGIFCSTKCNAAKSAVAATKKTREREKAKLLGVYRKAKREWNTLPATTKSRFSRKEWVLLKVNTDVFGGLRFSDKYKKPAWLTRMENGHTQD